MEKKSEPLIQGIDPLLSIIIVLVILIGTWSLLKDSLRLSLDEVPKDIDLENIKSKAIQIKGIKNIHLVHVWAMSTTENAMTAHIVIEDSSGKGQIENIKNNLKHALQNMNIQHITLETEFSSNPCEKIED